MYPGLLKPEYLAPLQANPGELDRILSSSSKPWCIIDEIQKVPEILDVVHSHIEKHQIKFALSSGKGRATYFPDRN